MGRPLHGLSQGCSKGVGQVQVSSEVSTGKGSPFKFLWLLVEFSSLRIIGLRASFPYWLLPRGHLFSLPHGLLYYGLLLHQGVQTQMRLQARRKLQYSLIMEVATHHLCHILLDRSNFQVLSHKRITQYGR